MSTLPIRATGIPWYRKEDYPRVLRMMIDAHVLPRTYRDWLQRAENVERAIQSHGQIAVRAVLDLDEFPGWCAAHGLNVDAKGRGQYAAWVAHRQVKETH